jgi:glycosyltransferase involved in cell wall biosynthesis
VLRDGENGLLVDIFKPEEIAQRVIAALQDRQAYDTIRANARRTIVENYDLKTICLPAQLKMLEMAVHAAG